jgi:hypothetical protein
MYTIEYNKALQNPSKFHSDLKSHAVLGPLYISFTSKSDKLNISFTRSLSQVELDSCGAFVRDYQPISLVDNLREYMKNRIEPYIEQLMLTIQAENISLGISSSGKTAEVIGFFTTPVTLPGKTRSITLKDSLDTNSLTVTLEIFQYFINNPQLYSDLAPFITAERLTKWRNDTITMLQS